MKTVLKFAAALFGTYGVAWTVAYLVTMYYTVLRIDFSQYFQWFVLAWTFRGFELVAFAWLLSVAIFVPLFIVVLLIWRKRNKRRRAENKPALELH